jgi:hypothetical protein
MVLGICPKWCSDSCSLRKSQRVGLTENLSPPHSKWLGNRNWLEILTGATADYGPPPVGTSPAFRWSVIAVKLSRRVGVSSAALWTSNENTSKWTSKSSYQNFKKIRKMFLQGSYLFFITTYKTSVQNLRSKLARSTLISPCTIRVKYTHTFYGTVQPCIHKQVMIQVETW